MAAAALGSFRAVALNVLWLRAVNRIEKREFLELPFLLEAIEELHGGSATLYKIQAHILAIDVPHVYASDDPARRRWIARGLRALDRGTRRFPRDGKLLEEAGYIYFVRFDSERHPEDRAWFLSDAEVNPARRDPLEISAAYLERAIETEDHGQSVDINLWKVQTLRVHALLDLSLEALAEPESRQAAARRIRERGLRAELEAIIAQSHRLLAHIESVHVREADGTDVQRFLKGWVAANRRELEEFRSFLDEASRPPPPSEREGEG
jgi:hypothetical protein